MKIGFIGCGNMGSALARSICEIPQTKVYISDSNTDKAKEFCSANGAVLSDNVQICNECELIFLAVKPNALPVLLPALSSALSQNKNGAIVSMAAGQSIAKIEELIGFPYPIIRIMPNTPAAVGKAMITWCKNALVTDACAEKFTNALSSAGKLDFIDERLIDAASAVAGCGPAFVYMFIEALADGGVECGLPREKAMLYAAETVKGAADMVNKTGKHPGQLKDEVCSPGGSTIEGVRTLEEGAFRATVTDAVISAYEKTLKLGKS